MPTYNLPPDTRAVGTGNPPLDMNSVVDVLNHSVYQRQFYIDQYGADPTGATASDTAWTNCYADAAAAVQGPLGTLNNISGGALIRFGPGVYTFSLGVVKISDARIGLAGCGKQVTNIRASGSSGILVEVLDSVLAQGAVGAPVGGFEVFGWATGNGVTGLHYGDRNFGTLYDVCAVGFQGTGSNGFLFSSPNNTSGGIEGSSCISLDARNNTNGYTFDGLNGNGSGDYSYYFLHAGGNANEVQIINQFHIVGASMKLSGNHGTFASVNNNMFVVGSSGTDTAKIDLSNLDICMEADGATTNIDFVLNGASGSGILRCHGQINLFNVSGTYTAGSISGGAALQLFGLVRGCPLATALASTKKWTPWTAGAIGSSLFAVDSTL